MTTERERFEAWAKTTHPRWRFDKSRSDDGYMYAPTATAWRAWQAALSAPPGYVMVPVEPTPEMIAADLASAICHNQSYAGRPMEVADLLAGIRACWSAMIAAAPSAKEQTP